MGDHGHLRKREDPPSDRGRMWGMGGVKGEKWRQDGTGTPERRLGEGKGSHAEGENWGTTGRAEDQKGVWPGFPCPLGPSGTC